MKERKLKIVAEKYLEANQQKEAYRAIEIFINKYLRLSEMGVNNLKAMLLRLIPALCLILENKQSSEKEFLDFFNQLDSLGQAFVKNHQEIRLSAARCIGALKERGEAENANTLAQSLHFTDIRPADDSDRKYITRLVREGKRHEAKSLLAIRSGFYKQE